LDGKQHVGSSSIKDAIRRYREDQPSVPSLEGINYNSIRLDGTLEVEKDFFEEQVWYTTMI